MVRYNVCKKYLFVILIIGSKSRWFILVVSLIVCVSIDGGRLKIVFFEIVFVFYFIL